MARKPKLPVTPPAKPLPGGKGKKGVAIVVEIGKKPKKSK